MWAVGCIFYELIKKKPLFPGFFCISLSANTMPGKEASNPRAFQEDQLIRIFSVLGAINKSKWKDVEYLESYSKIRSLN